MGHNLLPIIPTSAPWRAVVGIVAEGGSVETVAAASARAAEREFERAANDPLFAEAVYLLAALPAAARQADAVEALRRIGVMVGPDTSLPAMLGAVASHLDAACNGSLPRSDFSELCRRALVGALARQVGDRLPGLIEAEADEVLQALGRLGRPTEFPGLARDFFGRLVAETLANWLGRILPTQVGADLRFEDMNARTEFERALDLHVRETTRIIQEFSAGWYGKTLFQDDSISRDRARRFGAYAFTKIRAELARRAGDDD